MPFDERSKEDILALGNMDPELEKILKESGPPPPFPKEDIPMARKHIDALTAKAVANSADKADDLTITNITVAARDGFQIPVRSYVSKNTPDGDLRPLIVMIHGGGFCIGGLDFEEMNCREHVRRLGCVCINVGYRLAPEHQFPTPVYDCYDVVKWCTRNAEHIGADLSKGFVLSGPSAGSNLVDVCAHLARDEKLSPPLTGLCEMVPCIMHPSVIPDKYKDEHLSLEQCKDAPILTKDGYLSTMENYGGDVHSPLFVPFNHPDGHTGLPPVYFQVSGLDPTRDQGLIYEKVLRKEAGVPTRIDIYPGLPHGFNVMYPTLTASSKCKEDRIKGTEWLLSHS